jgi:hypothetical protein
MKKRFILLSALSVMLLAACLILWPERFPESAGEPTYHGRCLSDWVVDLNGRTLAFNQAALTAQATKAIRHIGTNATPFLTQYLLYQPPRWRIQMIRFKARMGWRLGNDWSRENPVIHKKILRSYGALNALTLLPSKDPPVMAALTCLLESQPDQLQVCQAVELLSRFGRPALPAWHRALTSPNPSVRLQATQNIARLGAEAAPLMPTLRWLLQDRDYAIRAEATNSMRQIAPHLLQLAKP